MTNTAVHHRINLRAELVNSIIENGIRCYGGPNNATVSNPNFRLNAGIRANRLVHGRG